MGKAVFLDIKLLDGTWDGIVRCGPKHGIVAYKIPRSIIESGKLESEECFEKEKNKFSQSAIYFLFGEDKNGKPAIYIGQAGKRKDNTRLLLRIKEHLKNQHGYEDLWTEALWITTNDNSYDTAEICYLEHIFFNKVNKDTYTVWNDKDPSSGDKDEDDLEDDIEKIILCTRSLGYKPFEAPISKKDLNKNTLTMKVGKEGQAIAVEKGAEFILVKGSAISPNVVKSCPQHIKLLRSEYNNTIIKNHKTTRDISFSSPSAAAQFVMGNSVNGRDAWKDSSGKSLKDLQQEALQQKK